MAITSAGALRPSADRSTREAAIGVRDARGSRRRSASSHAALARIRPSAWRRSAAPSRRRTAARASSRARRCRGSRPAPGNRPCRVAGSAPTGRILRTWPRRKAVGRGVEVGEVCTAAPPDDQDLPARHALAVLDQQHAGAPRRPACAAQIQAGGTGAAATMTSKGASERRLVPRRQLAFVAAGRRPGAWMPHSVLSQPRQRPARGSSPGATVLVQGWQPIER